ncbi:MAG: MFS transporter [Candidatus Tectomicrobia bacterium]|uniref:MFS transporter n=1 Tax=Tectimicrobiota bacterium TaxID=2528274 RepID=A0A932CPS7_UNCTE|nr:MFS transporter [Candidatus Tectomicrobia bacterium]
MATASRGGVFYGWWVVGALFVSNFVVHGLGVYGFSPYVKVLSDEFGWSRAATGGGGGLILTMLGLSGLLVGFLVDRYGPRKVIGVGGLLAGLGFLLLSRLTTLFQFYAFALTLGLGVALAGPIAPYTAVPRWFVRKKGVAMGIVSAGIGLGGLFMVQLANLLIVRYGWQAALIFSGVITLLLAPPVVFAVVRSWPQDIGILPDGGCQAEAGREPKAAAIISAGTETGSPGSSSGSLRDMTFKETLKTKTVWLITVAYVFTTFASSGIIMHLYAYLTDIGISKEIAAGTLGFMTGVSAFGRFGLGFLSDWLPNRYVLATSYGLRALGVGTLLLLLFFPFPGALVLYVILYGIGVGGAAVVPNLIVAEHYGAASMGKIIGLARTFYSLGMLSGPIVAGWVYDATGSYRWALVLMMAALTVAALTVLFIPAVPTRERYLRVAEPTVPQSVGALGR